MPTPPTVVVMSRCSWTLHNFRRPLMRALTLGGSRVLAFGAGGDGYDARLIDEGFEFGSMPFGSRRINPVEDLVLVGRLARRLRELKPSVAHAFTIRPAIFGTIAAALAGVPVRVVTITGLGHAFTTGSPQLRYIVESLYRVALRYADVVFFENPDDRDLFVQRKLVSLEQCELVPGTGVDVDRFARVALPCEHGDAICVLMISRLLKEKGVYDYLGAARALSAKYPNVRFRLLGGPDPRNPSSLTREDIRAEAAAARVDWVDEVVDVRPYIAEADVVVLPSYREGLPRSLLEAASMGRPLVTTDVPGCREVVTEGVNGFRVPVRDPAALAQAIERLIVDRRMLQEMGKKSRQMVEARFDERIVIERTLRAYGELVDRKGSGPATSSAERPEVAQPQPR